MSDDDDDDDELEAVDRLIAALNLKREITPRIQALTAAMNTVPDRAGIRELLETYFVGPITEADVDRVETSFVEIYNSRGDWSGYSRSFQSPTEWQGKAWNEEFCLDRKHMTPRDLVLMLGNMFADVDDHPVAPVENAFPRPKLYCPIAMAGAWEQLEPAPPTSKPIVWHLGADGSFQTNDPAREMYRLWSVKKGFGPPEPTVRLQLHQKWSESGPIYRVGLVGNELVGKALDGWKDPPLRLRRIESGR